MISMTGFASRRLVCNATTFLVNLKSWNNRYLELNIQLPASCLSLERSIRSLLEQHIHRGKIEFSLKSDSALVTSNLNFNEDMIQSVAATLRRMAKAAGIKEKITLAHVLSVEGLLQFDRSLDTDQLWQSLQLGILECIKDFQMDRKREGDATAIDIESKLVVLERALDAIQILAPTADAGIQANLRKKFEEVLGSQLDENRILTEIAVYLAKYTINEELVRLRAHLQSFRTTMQEPTCGKKLDFICQELNREANTIGSKTSTAEISGYVILIKEAIENIREQIRNIE
jgi:uncharacterized protein (TIGR00255 family)